MRAFTARIVLLAALVSWTIATGSAVAQLPDASTQQSELPLDTVPAVTTAAQYAPEIAPEIACPTTLVPPGTDAAGNVVRPGGVKMVCQLGCITNPQFCVGNCGFGGICVLFPPIFICPNDLLQCVCIDEGSPEALWAKAYAR